MSAPITVSDPLEQGSVYMCTAALTPDTVNAIFQDFSRNPGRYKIFYFAKSSANMASKFSKDGKSMLEVVEEEMKARGVKVVVNELAVYGPLGDNMIYYASNWVGWNSGEGVPLPPFIELKHRVDTWRLKKLVGNAAAPGEGYIKPKTPRDTEWYQEFLSAFPGRERLVNTVTDLRKLVCETNLAGVTTDNWTSIVSRKCRLPVDWNERLNVVHLLRMMEFDDAAILTVLHDKRKKRLIEILSKSFYPMAVGCAMDVAHALYCISKEARVDIETYRAQWGGDSKTPDAFNQAQVETLTLKRLLHVVSHLGRQQPHSVTGGISDAEIDDCVAHALTASTSIQCLPFITLMLPRPSFTMAMVDKEDWVREYGAMLGSMGPNIRVIYDRDPGHVDNVHRAFATLSIAMEVVYRNMGGSSQGPVRHLGDGRFCFVNAESGVETDMTKEFLMYLYARQDPRRLARQ